MANNFDFKGKVVLITGSSSGLGAQTAIEYSKSGAQVVTTGRNALKLSEVGKKCLKVSPNCLKALEIVRTLLKRKNANHL